MSTNEKISPPTPLTARGEFVDANDVDRLAAQQKSIRATMTPAQLAMSDEAERVMLQTEREIELGIYEEKQIAEKVQVGQYVIDGRKAMFKTPNGTLEEAGMYVHRLEAAVIGVMDKLTKMTAERDSLKEQLTKVPAPAKVKKSKGLLAMFRRKKK